MKKLILIVTVLVLAGCASNKIWTHPTKNALDFEQDKHECLAWAGQVSGGLGEYGNPLTVRNLAMDCLRTRGWR